LISELLNFSMHGSPLLKFVEPRKWQGATGDVLTLLGGTDPATDFGFLTAAAPRQRDA
jgi:hypothetical protein